jgi:3-hydroxyacyl-[acyl-carrier-protein] dehydratase
LRTYWLDRVLSIVPQRSIVAELDLPPDDEIFRHHFPGNPMLPGSALLEAFAQTASLLLETDRRLQCKVVPGYILGARFLRPIRPGVLRLEIVVEQSDDDGAVVRGAAHADGERCATCRLGMVISPLDEFLGAANAAAYRESLTRWLRSAAPGLDVSRSESVPHGSPR